MSEKENIQDLELEVEKALDKIFKEAKKTELKEEEIETYSLLEPVAEGEEGLKKDLEELIGEILTLEWEIVPEISEKALKKCQKLKSQSLDATNQELISLLEAYLKEVKHPANLTPEKLDHLKQLGNIIYVYNFEDKNIEKDLKEFKAKIEKEVAEQSKPEEIMKDFSHKKSPKGEHQTKINLLINQLLKDYQRLVAIKELLDRNKKRAIKKLLTKSKYEIEKTLLTLNKDYEKQLREREKEIKEFIRQKEETTKTQIKIEANEGLLCKTLNKTILIPIDEVAFASDIEDWWRPYLHEGQFPLKLLRGKGFLKQLFGKIKPKLQGELAEKEEQELKKLRIKTNKLLTSEKKLIILWKNGKGLVVLVEDYKLINIDPNTIWRPAKEPFIGKALIEGREVFLFSITK